MGFLGSSLGSAKEKPMTAAGLALKSAPPVQVPYVDLAAQYEQERDEILARVDQVFRSGQFVGGAFVERFESAAARYIGVPQVVGVNSGTDALELGLWALGIGPGDEVITPPNSYIASTAAIQRVGATPVFADVGPDQNIDPAAIEAAISPRTVAIMVVHLTGRMADMAAVMAIADRHGLAVIEDAAQAMGSTFDGRRAGSFGAIGCFSAHPVKNLNAAGDAGFIATRDVAVARRLRNLRRHGLETRDRSGEWGTVSRLDNLQAAILELRLEKLDGVIAARRRNAAVYQDRLTSPAVFRAPDDARAFNTFHTYVIQSGRRDALQDHLAQTGIGSAVHYPVPIHLQPAARDLDYAPGAFPETESQAQRILSLPIHQYLDVEAVAHIAACIEEFFATTV
jgi:dTDP-4-amino-4,6-dideoxygalactose transaminase